MALAAFFIFFDNRFLLPWLPLLGGGDGVYYGVPLLMCAVELTYWYWFLGWFPRWSVQRELPQEYSQEFLDRILRLWPQLRDIAVGSWKWLDAFVRAKLFEDGPRRRRWGTILLKAIKGGSWVLVYLWIAILGVLPLGWLVAIPICRTHRVRFGFSVLLVSAMLSTAMIAWLGYGPITWLWHRTGCVP
jgi:hypothetical protein